MSFQIGSVIQKILFFIQYEAFLFLWGVLAISFLFYRFLLKEISTKRHMNLKNRFKSTLIFLSLSSLLTLSEWALRSSSEWLPLIKTSQYIAFFALVMAATTLVKVAQITIYLVLFYKNISQGIPRLIANLFTVMFSIFVISIIASEVFSIHLTAMLATSAVFSLVLGLALQDTLGNLFSGVAMQIGQPFKIGDWVEIASENRKWLGQIQEITWRSTFLVNFSDETIMIPNKTIAQSQITIFSNQQKPNRESQTFRIDFHQDIGLARQTLHDVVAQTPGVMQEPGPRVLLIETTESWIVMKVFYSVNDFSMKYRVADAIIENVISSFFKNKINLASSKISLISGSSFKTDLN